MKHHRVRLGQPELDEPALETGLLAPQDGLPTDEVFLAGFHGKTEACFQHMVLIRDVVAEMTEGLFDAAAVEGMQPAKLEPHFGTGFHHGFEDMCGLIGGNIKLPTEFADIADPMGARQTHPDLDLARPAEGMGVVAEVIGADQSHQVAGLGPHDAQDGFLDGGVGDDDELVFQMPF